MHIGKKQFLTIGVLVLMALSVSAFMMYIALDHNPMGEFREYRDQPGGREGRIQWLHLLDLGFLWFIFSLLVFGAIALFIKAVLRLFSR